VIVHSVQKQHIALFAVPTAPTLTSSLPRRPVKISLSHTGVQQDRDGDAVCPLHTAVAGDLLTVGVVATSIGARVCLSKQR